MKFALVGAECEENLALRYIRAALEGRGHSATQITFNSETDTEGAAECLARSGAGLAGFSMVFTYRAAEFAALARRCRELGFRGHLVADGHFAAFNAEALLRDVAAFDSVAIGEGEELICALAEQLDSPAEVRGLVWRNGGGAVRRNAPAEKPPDLDRLPLPTRLEPPDSYLGLPVANMLGSRGCTHTCAFCSIAAWHRLCAGARLRLREPAAIAEEMVSKDGKIGKVSVTRLVSGQKPTVVTNLVHTRAALASMRIKEPMVRAKSWFSTRQPGREFRQPKAANAIYFFTAPAAAR